MGIVKGENSLFFASGLDNSGLLRGRVEAEGIVQTMARNIASINPFAALSIGAVAAFALIGIESGKMVKEFDKAMKEVETISEATQNNFKGISSQVFDISKDAIDKPKELAESYYQVVSAGYDGAEGLNVLKDSSDLAIAGVTDTKVAADGLTTVLNAYKLAAEQSTEVSDAFFNTVKLGKTTVDEIASSISIVAPIASASNIPLNEVLSTLATLTKQGVPTSVAMTQIRSAIVGMSEAGKLDGAKTLQQNLQALFDEMEGSQPLIQETVGRIEAVQAVLGVSGKNALSAAKDLETYNNVLGATEKASRQMLEENGNQWQIFRNRVNAVTKSVGESVLETSTDIAKDLNKIIDSTKDYTLEVENEATAIRNLIDDYRDANPESDERLRILESLKNINPSIVDGITNESDAYKVLTQNLSEYNSALTERRLIAGKKNDFEELKLELFEVQDSRRKAEESFKKSIQDYAKSEFVQGYEPLKQVVESVQNLDVSEFDKIKKIQEYLNSEEFQGPGISLFTDNYGFDYDQRDFDLYKVQALDVEVLTEKLKNLKNEVSDAEINFSNLDSEFGDVIAKINKVNTSNGLSLFKNDGYRQEIQDAVTAREQIIGEFEKIGNINLKGFKGGELTPFLNSDNEDVQKRALEKQSQFNKEIKADNDQKNLEYEKSLDKFAEHIRREKKLFELKEKASAIGDDKTAKQLSPGDGQKDFDTYVKDLLSKTQDLGKKKILLNFLKLPDKEKIKTDLDVLKEDVQSYLSKDFFEEQGLDLSSLFVGLESKGDDLTEYLRSKFVELSNIEIDASNFSVVEDQLKFIQQTAERNNIQLKVSADVDTTSLEALSKALYDLERKYALARTDEERNVLNKKIEYKEYEIKAVEDASRGIIDIESKRFDFLNTLSIKRLADEKKRIDEEIKLLEEKAKKEKAKTGKVPKGTDASLNALEKKGNEVASEMAGKIAGGFQQGAGYLSQASDLFAKFGDEDTSTNLDQLAGVASGAARIAAGDYIGGGLEVLNSALTVEVVSDTAALEKAIDDLEKASELIANNIENYAGIDKAKAKLDLIQNIEEQKIKIAEAKEAEEKARKEVKFLGAKLGDKGSGSGTSAAKLEELEDQANAAKQEVIELEEEYNEFVTGTTRVTLADSIIEGLKDGKTAVEDFADDFNSIVGEGIIETFKREQLAQASKDFLTQLGEAYDTNKDGVSDLEIAEILAAKALYDTTTENAISDFEELKEKLLEAGIDLDEINGGSESSGLSGAIKSELTEETGSELTGLYRAMYELNKQHFQLYQLKSSGILDQSIQANIYLNDIRTNTANTVLELKNAVLELKTIKDNTKETYSRL